MIASPIQTRAGRAAGLEPLPDQVLVKVALSLVGELERSVIIIVRSLLAGGSGGIVPWVDHLDADFLLARASIGVGCLIDGLLLLERRQPLGLLFLHLEHDVRFQRQRPGR